MRISHDDEVDILYIQLRDGIHVEGTPIAPPRPPIDVASWMRIDVDDEGEPSGIEIEGASRRALLDSMLVTNLALAGIDNQDSLKRMGLIDMEAFAKLARLSVSTLRDHRSSRSKSPLPAPAMHVGKSPLWQKADAAAWIKTRDDKPGKAARGRGARAS